jgi:hypothetical protein
VRISVAAAAPGGADEAASATPSFSARRSADPAGARRSSSTTAEDGIPSATVEKAAIESGEARRAQPAPAAGGSDRVAPTRVTASDEGTTLRSGALDGPASSPSKDGEPARDLDAPVEVEPDLAAAEHDRASTRDGDDPHGSGEEHGRSRGEPRDRGAAETARPVGPGRGVTATAAAPTLAPEPPAIAVARPAFESGPVATGAGLPTARPDVPAASPSGTTLPQLHQAALAETIVARARSLAGDGSLEVRFALEPEDLGTVRIRIEARGDELRIRIVASSVSAAEALSVGLSRLTAQLTENGGRPPLIDLAFEDRPHDRAPHHPRDGGRRETPGPRSAPWSAVAPAAPLSSRFASRLDRVA